MDEKRLLLFVKINANTLDEALGFVAGNYIDIGGSMIGLTVGNAVKAMKFVMQNYKEINGNQHSVTNDETDTICRASKH